MSSSKCTGKVAAGADDLFTQARRIATQTAPILHCRVCGKACPPLSAGAHDETVTYRMTKGMCPECAWLHIPFRDERSGG